MACVCVMSDDGSTPVPLAERELPHVAPHSMFPMMDLPDGYDICAHVEDHTEEFFLDRDVVQDGVHWLLRCIRFDVSLMFGRYSVCGAAPCWTEPMSAGVSRGKRRLG